MDKTSDINGTDNALSSLSLDSRINQSSDINGEEEESRNKSIRRKDDLPLLGFFASDGGQTSASFLSTSKEGKVIHSHDFTKKLGSLVAGSSDGTILCERRSMNYHVCNPFTNQWLSLPKPKMKSPVTAVGFFCEEKSANGFLHFKVIRVSVKAVVAAINTLNIETFSSETGEWKESKLTEPSNLRISTCTRKCRVINGGRTCYAIDGILYWDAWPGFIAAYDSKMAENFFWLIELPLVTQKAMAITLGESSEGLLQCAIGDAHRFGVHVLKNKLSCYDASNIIPKTEWMLKHVAAAYSEMSIRYSPQVSSDKFPLMIAFHPHNSLYFRVGRELFCYGVDDRKLESVPYLGLEKLSCYHVLVPYLQPDLVASLPSLPSSVSGLV